MSLLEFINSVKNWKEILSAPPYNIIIKEEDDYILLKYNQLSSDFSFSIVRECRGCIISYDDTLDKYVYVCRPFDKFFNYGEDYANEIDWSTAKCTEKIDGSLIKVWYDLGRWHISTNGNINAFNAFINGSDTSFGDLFERCLKKYTDEYWEDFCNRHLREDCTYMFEITSPESQVVIPYEDNLYFLACRENYNGKYTNDSIPYIKKPNIYELNSLDKVVKFISLWEGLKEGIVVSDAQGRRIKVKSAKYLEAAHILNNGKISDKSILKLILNEQVDDFTSQTNFYTKQIEEVKNKLNALIDIMNKTWEENEKYATGSKIDFAMVVKENKYKDFLFKKFINRDLTSFEYLQNQNIKIVEKMVCL